MADLIDMAVDYQQRHGLTGVEMARRLGIQPSMWSMVRNRKMAAGRKVLEGLAGIDELTFTVSSAMRERAAARTKLAVEVSLTRCLGATRRKERGRG